MEDQKEEATAAGQCNLKVHTRGVRRVHGVALIARLKELQKWKILSIAQLMQQGGGRMIRTIRSLVSNREKEIRLCQFGQGAKLHGGVSTATRIFGRRSDRSKTETQKAGKGGPTQTGH